MGALAGGQDGEQGRAAATGAAEGWPGGDPALAAATGTAEGWTDAEVPGWRRLAGWLALAVAAAVLAWAARRW
jgi:hypothetical protein